MAWPVKQLDSSVLVTSRPDPEKPEYEIYKNHSDPAWAVKDIEYQRSITVPEEVKVFHTSQSKEYEKVQINAESDEHLIPDKLNIKPANYWEPQ